MFKGDNFIKFSGDALNLIQQEAFMVKANQTMKEGQRDDETQGNELNTIAMPSQIEILRKAHEQRKQDLQETQLRKILDTYGGEQHLQVPIQLKEAIASQIQSQAQNLS